MQQGEGIESGFEDLFHAMKWPMNRRIYVSGASWIFTFALLFNATAITTAVPDLASEFDISTEKAIITYSLFVFGIAFAPLFTPHISERVGRTPTYFAGTLLSSIILLGASRAQSFNALAATRFFAGLCQGPVVVLIEGTFADIWPAKFTGSYYIIISSSQYFGAATGAVLGGVVNYHKGWRWTQYTGLMVNLFAIVFGAGLTETYPRLLTRQFEKRAGMSATQQEAPSGETVSQMVRLTVINPLVMLFTEPLVIFLHLALITNFGVLFQFFILVPQVLKMLVNFDSQQSGFAFVAAFGGMTLAIATTLLIDQICARSGDVGGSGKTTLEYRMVPAMLGSFLMVASLFWIGWTSNLQNSYTTPIIGTAFYVWGSAITLTSYVAYLFDAYSPPATLSALTACAVTRVLAAGWFPLFILTAVMNIGGSWTLSAFGFSAIAVLPVPFIIFLYGAKFRKRSHFSKPSVISAEGVHVMEIETGKV